MYDLKDYDYFLPEERIAQEPAPVRDRSRLLCLDKASGRMTHRFFHQIVERLDPGDLLVINDTRVIPARLKGKKETGGGVELLLLDFPGFREMLDAKNVLTCQCLIKASKRPKAGSRLIFSDELTAQVRRSEDTTAVVSFFHPDGLRQILDRIGEVPLPPYIKKPAGHTRDLHHRRYQTVYAQNEGAVAAPTAGFHFTETLLEDLSRKGVQCTRITLHIGYGTFNPVRVKDIRQHRMHTERFTVRPEAAREINRAKSQGKRVVAVGTTCVRTLEYASDENGTVSPGSGACDLFIYPGYRFKVVDAVITNFHLPKSTLLMLVSAFAGRDYIFRSYKEAIEKGYRFYSYGDAMYIY